jgi:hypothetical protein
MSEHGSVGVGAGEDEIPYLPMKDLLFSERTVTPGCILLPYNAGQFHFRNGMIQILPTFHGMDSEKPYLHLREFEEACETFGDQACPQDVIRLKLFPFSLKDKAKTWLWSLPPNSVLSWRDMQAKFL